MFLKNLDLQKIDKKSCILVFDLSFQHEFLSLLKTLIDLGLSFGFGNKKVLETIPYPFEEILSHKIYSIKIKLKEQSILCFSSGTDNRPKAILRSIKSWHNSFSIVKKILKNDLDAVGIFFGKLTHSLPLFSCLESLSRNQLPILLPPLKILSFFEIKSNSNFIIWSTPVHLHFIVDYFIKKKTTSKKNIRYVFIGGTSLTPQLKENIKEVFHNPLIYEFFGSSETSFISIKHPEDPIQRYSRVCDGVSVKILNSAHQKLPSSKRGFLWIKSNQLFTRYLSKHKIKRLGSYICIDDMGSREKNGWIRFEGRSNEWITISGNNINISDLEIRIQKLLDLDEMILLELSDRKKENYLVLVIKQQISNFIWSEWKCRIRNQFGSQCIPRLFHVFSHWPLLASGKLDRKKIKYEIQQSLYHCSEKKYRSP
ncbi:MAG: AMP-binding protein [Flavobacteriaceae bacterium]